MSRRSLARWIGIDVLAHAIYLRDHPRLGPIGSILIRDIKISLRTLKNT